jgi:hypothetical protein
MTAGEAEAKGAVASWAEIEGRYWEAVWWLNRAVLEEKGDDRAVAYGRSATLFADVIAKAGMMQETDLK